MIESLASGMSVAILAATFILFVSGLAVWTVNRRRACKDGHSGRPTPRWLRLATIGCALLTAMSEACLFASRRSFASGASCVLWIVVSALWIAAYRAERRNERRDD